MPLSAPCRRDAVRERLEATGSGIRELDYLRDRQEELVRTALQQEEQEEQEEAQLLEDNILLLRKQLNCLRRRDAGLISQLQELDRQISDLRLDTKESRDQLETDSRPSSGFYELSDGASCSLSNSSNSVFSECFCSMAETDGRLRSADDLSGCLECDSLVGGLCDSSSSGTVRRSLSAPHPVSSVASCDSQSKYHCDLVARNGGDIYRYPSPLHAVAVQSPVFLQMLGHSGLRSVEAGGEVLRPESSPLSAPLVPQSSSWPASSSSSSSHKRLDGYIYGLLQRRALPVRTSRPRTSISTDPSKSALRQAGFCGRSVSGLGTLRGSEFKPSWSAGGAPGEGGATSSPERHWSVDGTPEEQETQMAVDPDGGVDTAPNSFKINDSDLTSSPLCVGSSVSNSDTNGLLRQKSRRLPPPLAASEDVRPKENSSPKETKQPCCCPDPETLLKSPPGIRTSSVTPQNGPKPPQPVQTERVDEVASLGSSSQSQDEAGGAGGAGGGAEGAGGAGGGTHMVNAGYIPAQRQNVKLRKGGSKNVSTVKVKTTAPMKTSRASEHNEPPSDRRGDASHHRSSSRKSRLLEDRGAVSIKASKRAGGAHATSISRIKRLPASIPEGRVLDKQTTSTLSMVRSGASRHHHHGNHHRHHHHHGRDQVVVVAKPKHKRNDYRRLRAIMEVPYDEAFRRAQRRQRKELLSQSAASVYIPAAEQASSPYSYVAGSDSEYSAECASLFHSTIVDTSEDDRSNYTTNRFGDSEFSEEDDVEESDTEESAGGGIGRGWSQLGAAGTAVGQEMTPAQAKAFVKIKASHNLKKKILRFRSGSLKLMTTV